MEQRSARKKFLATTLESTRKSYYPQLLKQLEASKENAKSLQLLIDSMPALISYLDKDLKFVLVNSEYEKALGLKRSEITGKTLQETIGYKEFKKIEKYISLALSGKSGNFEVELELKGRKRWFNFSYVPNTDSSGDVKGFYALVLDLTQTIREKEEKELLKERLRQSQKMEAIGTLASGIAHDFNNILSGIFGYSQLIQNNITDSMKTASYVENIIDSAKRASALIHQILTFSRQSKSKMKALNLNEIVKDTLVLLRSTIPSSIDLKEEILTDDQIYGDSTQIHQVIMNLCTNAYHAIGNNNGCVTLRIERADTSATSLNGKNSVKKRVLLKITDTGSGIDKKIVEKIFDPYFTTKDVGKGTGLGLSVVRGIVKKHNGTIEVESEKEKGSTFKVFFPVLLRDDTKKKKTKEVKEAYLGNETVMLVDDEPAILQTLKIILESKGYAVKTFNNGEAALYEFTGNKDLYDIVVTDMTMPKMKGDRLASELTKIKPDLPVIILSGYLEEVDQELLSETGVKKYMQKPVLGSDLLKNLREVLD